MSDMSKFESLDKIYAIETPSKLDCAVMAYGDWQNASDEELEEAEEAAAELLKLREDLHAVADLKDEIALALEVASIARVWGNPSPFQDKINELLVKAGRKPISPDKAFTLPK